MFNTRHGHSRHHHDLTNFQQRGCGLRGWASGAEASLSIPPSPRHPTFFKGYAVILETSPNKKTSSSANPSELCGKRVLHCNQDKNTSDLGWTPSSVLERERQKIIQRAGSQRPSECLQPQLLGQTGSILPWGVWIEYNFTDTLTLNSRTEREWMCPSCHQYCSIAAWNRRRRCRRCRRVGVV